MAGKIILPSILNVFAKQVCSNAKKSRCGSMWSCEMTKEPCPVLPAMQTLLFLHGLASEWHLIDILNLSVLRCKQRVGRF